MKVFLFCWVVEDAVGFFQKPVAVYYLLSHYPSPFVVLQSVDSGYPFNPVSIKELGRCLLKEWQGMLILEDACEIEDPTTFVIKILACLKF